MSWEELVASAIGYLLGLALASARWAPLVRLLVAGISAAERSGETTAKDAVKSVANGDPTLAATLDKVDPHTTPRVSKARRVGEFLLNLIPVFGQLRGMGR